MNPHESPIPPQHPYEIPSMNPEYGTPHHLHQQADILSQNEQLIHAVSNILIQVNQTNQALMNYLTLSTHNTQPRTDTKVRPKAFSGLPTEDVLMWLDHFENVASYHQWDDRRKALEVRTLLENVAATWFIQQQEEVKQNWSEVKRKLIQNFANQDVTQTALQQLQSLRQQQHEPVPQFAIKLNQLLMRADPTMSEEMKLFFLWPRLRHDISRRVRDQGPTNYADAIKIAQRIEMVSTSDYTSNLPLFQHPPKNITEPSPVPMDIDIQNAQTASR